MQHDINRLNKGPDPICGDALPITYKCQHNELFIGCLNRNITAYCAVCGCSVVSAVNTIEIEDPHNKTKRLIVRVCTNHTVEGEALNDPTIYSPTLGTTENSHLDARGRLIPKVQRDRQNP